VVDRQQGFSVQARARVEAQFEARLLGELSGATVAIGIRIQNPVQETAVRLASVMSREELEDLRARMQAEAARKSNLSCNGPVG